jgi:hypothetical protein
MEPSVVVSAVSALAAIGAVIYTGITAREQRKTRRDDKFPYMVVRSIEKRTGDGLRTGNHELRLVNLGRGPAFITMFRMKGLSKSSRNEKIAQDGDHTHMIDRVIGPEVGNPDLQCWFAHGTPDVLRREEVSIGLEYKDIGNRVFRSGIINGKPVWDHPLEFSHTKFSLWLQKLRGKEEQVEGVKELREFLAK